MKLQSSDQKEQYSTILAYEVKGKMIGLLKELCGTPEV